MKLSLTPLIKNVFISLWVAQLAITPAFADVTPTNAGITPPSIGGGVVGPLVQNPTQQQDIQAANKLLNEAKMALTVSTAGWAAEFAVCGYNCFNYEYNLPILRHNVFALGAQFDSAVGAATTAAAGAAGVATPLGVSCINAFSAYQAATVSGEGTRLSELANANMDSVAAGALLAAAPGLGTVAAAGATAHVPANELMVTTAQAQIAAAAPVTAACPPAAGAIQASAATFQAAIGAYTGAITSIMSLGGVCNYLGLGMGALDVGSAMMIAGKGNQSASSLPQAASMNNIVGLMGPVSSIIAEKILATGNALVTHNAEIAGVSSCGMAGLALYETVTNDSELTAVANEKKKNDQTLQNLQSSAALKRSPLLEKKKKNEFWTPSRFWAAIQLSEKFGKWISNAIILDAYAATNPNAVSKYSSCMGPGGAPTDYMTCVANADPLLAKTFSKMPGGADALFEKFMDITKAPKSVATSNQFPLTLEQAVSWATAAVPSFHQKVMNIAMETKSQVYAQKGVKPNLGVLAQAAPASGNSLLQPQMPQPQSQSQGRANGVSLLSFGGSAPAVDSPSLLSSPDMNPSGSLGAKSAEATRDPAAAENTHLNLFDRVTSRYQTVLDRVDPTKQALKDWGKSGQQQSLNN